MTADLEATYRRALGWYPKRWRAENEDAVVGTLLDQAEDEKRLRPTRGELPDLRKTGLLAHFAFVGRALPSGVRTRAGVATLGLGFAISAGGLFFGGLTWAQAIAGGSYEHVWLISAFWQAMVSGQGVFLFWFAAGVASFIGFRRTAIALLAVFLPASVVWPGVAWQAGLVGHPGVVTLGFLDLLAVVAILGLTARPDRLRTRTVTSAATGVVALVGANELLTLSHGYGGNGASNIDFFWAPLAIWLVFLGLPLALILSVVFARLGRRTLAGSLLLAITPVAPLGLLAFAWRDDVPVLAGILAAVIVGIAVVVGILRLFGLRVRITRA